MAHINDLKLTRRPFVAASAAAAAALALTGCQAKTQVANARPSNWHFHRKDAGELYRFI